MTSPTNAGKRPTAILLISCPDQKGLVATVSDFVYRNQGNIIHADQHTDQERGIFLQRVEWDFHDFRIPRDEIAAAFEPIAQQFGMQWQLRFSDHTPRLAIFVSREAHCLLDLLARWQMDELPADIPLVVSNHESMRAAAENAGATYLHFPVSTATKQAQEASVLAALDEHNIDVVILARYMQILTDNFVQHYPERIINIHHSFLPAFAGSQPYHQAHERGVKIIGATAHYVTAELDEGPIIEQDVVRVSHRDSIGDLIRKGRDLEKVVLARAVRMHLLHRVLVYGTKTVVFD